MASQDGSAPVDGDLGYWRAEASRLAAENAELRAENDVQRGRIADLEGQVAALAEKVAALARLAFGTSSEKQASAGKRPADGAGDGGQPDAGTGRRRGQQPGSPGHPRRDYSHLPTTEEVHDVAEDERVCPRCAAPYAPFGEETCEQIDWAVTLTRTVHRRPSYRRTCRCPVRGVLVAPPPIKPIGKGRFTAGFLARLLVEKFVLGRPVHRIVAALAFEGLDLAEGTLAGVFAALAGLLAPLAAAMAARNARAAHLHADETRWHVFAAVDGKDSTRWWLWVFVGPDTTVFRIARSRSFAVLAEHLGVDPDTGELPEGRTLLLSSDFYAVYQVLGAVDGVDTLWCWSHIRRYFVRAGDAHPELAAWAAGWVERIGALYLARQAMNAADPAGSAYRYAAAQFSAALNGIDADRRTQAGNTGLHPAAARVLATLDREWEGLARHKEFPQAALDNNAAERALRTPVVGRKNYYGSGSVVSAELASAAWTVTATAQRAGLNPLAYLTAYLDACAQAGGKAPTGEALSAFLPWAASDNDLADWRRSGRTGPEGTGTEGTGPGPDRCTGPAP
jgi:transposase